MIEAGEAISGLQRCGLSQVTTRTWTFEEDVAAYALGGWGAIGVWLQKLEERHMGAFRFPSSCLSDDVVDLAAATLQAASLPVSHVVCAGLITDPDKAELLERVRHLRFALDAARRFQAACLIVIPGRLLGQPYQAAFDNACRVLADVLDELPNDSVRIAIEPVTDVDFANTTGRALDLVERLDHPALGVYLDTYHGWHEQDLYEQIARATGRIHGIHVADGRPDSRERLVPGDGQIDLDAILAATRAAGYRGTFDLELLGDEIWRIPPLDLLTTCAHRMQQLSLAHDVPTAGRR